MDDEGSEDDVERQIISALTRRMLELEAEGVDDVVEAVLERYTRPLLAEMGLGDRYDEFREVFLGVYAYMQEGGEGPPTGEA